MNTIQKINLAIILTIVPIGAILPLNFASGIMVSENDKPAKPEFHIINENISKPLDSLYQKFPNLTQSDVISVYIKISDACEDNEYDKQKKHAEFDPFSTTDIDSYSEEQKRLKMCDAFSSTLIKKYLDKLEIQYYPSEDPGNVPDLV